MSADYQFRLPTLLSYAVPVTIICAIITGISFYVSEYNIYAGYALAIIFTLVAVVYLGLYLIVKRFTSLERRLKDRDVLLNCIPWKGDEQVLDIGCGNGILILGAAKRLTNGKAIGIDIWTENSGDNRKEVFEKNSEIEGVKDKVELQMEDARNLPYGDAMFDVILCGLTMHHILHDSGADKAIKEMVRVLKFDGYIAIYDVPIAINAVTRLLKREGISVAKLNSRIITGHKSVN